MSGTLKAAITALKGRIADAYTAISAKGGTLPATQDSANLPTAIASIPTGGGEVEPNDFNFVDCFGLQQSYSKAEIDAMTELPTPKSYNGLTFDGWSRTLAELKALPFCTVGAWYKSSDGSTQVVVVIKAGDTIAWEVQSAIGSIDWGDGNTTECTGQWQFDHTYNDSGNYKIIFYPANENVHTYVRIYDINANSLCPIKEMYLSGNENGFYFQLLKNTLYLDVLCMSKSSSIPIYSNYFLTGGLPKSLVCPSVATTSSWPTYMFSAIRNLRYLVADGMQVISAQLQMPNMISFSMKSATSFSSVSGYPYMSALEYLRLEEGMTGWPRDIFANSALIKKIDLPSTITAISTSLTVIEEMYIRTATPPTYAFAWNLMIELYPYAVIHVKADAEYTDGDNVTWYGVEAYEHATNWSGFAGKYIADL